VSQFYRDLVMLVAFFILFAVLATALSAIGFPEVEPSIFF